MLAIANPAGSVYTLHILYVYRYSSPYSFDSDEFNPLCKTRGLRGGPTPVLGRPLPVTVTWTGDNLMISSYTLCTRRGITLDRKSSIHFLCFAFISGPAVLISHIPVYILLSART